MSDDGSDSEEDYVSDTYFEKINKGEKEERSRRVTERKYERCESDEMSNVLYQAQNPVYSNYKKK